MPASNSIQPQTICDGGFRIEIAQDEVTVTADPSAWRPRAGLRNARILKILAIPIFLFLLVPKLTDAPVPTLAVSAFIAAGFLWARYSAINNIHCTRQGLEVVRLRRARETGRWLFPRELIKQITFAAVSYSRSGSTFALVFEVQGRKVKVLRGIECPEAQTVLRELQRLGFDTVQDVGMPMMVEMALERRGKLRT